MGGAVTGRAVHTGGQQPERRRWRAQRSGRAGQRCGITSTQGVECKTSSRRWSEDALGHGTAPLHMERRADAHTSRASMRHLHSGPATPNRQSLERHNKRRRLACLAHSPSPEAAGLMTSTIARSIPLAVLKLQPFPRSKPPFHHNRLIVPHQRHARKTACALSEALSYPATARCIFSDRLACLLAAAVSRP